MALSEAMQKLIDEASTSANQRRQAHEDEAFNFYDTARDRLARLGFEKATKEELKQIILEMLAMEREERLAS